MSTDVEPRARNGMHGQLPLVPSIKVERLDGMGLISPIYDKK